MGEGVKKSQNSVDVVYGSPLVAVARRVAVYGSGIN